MGGESWPQKKMPKRFRKRREADLDLASIWRFIAADNPNAANAVLNRIGDVFTLLTENPLAGRDRAQLRPGLRSFVVGSYVVFYFARADGIEIVRVINSRKNITVRDIP
jgi:toxin ParE1/3/4